MTLEETPDTEEASTTKVVQQEAASYLRMAVTDRLPRDTGLPFAGAPFKKARRGTSQPLVFRLQVAESRVSSVFLYIL